MERYTNINFTIIDSIGNNEGRNSKVYLAKDNQLDTKLVIKEMSIKSFDKIEDYFLEAKILYDSKHPNIAEIQYASQDDENIYLAMPYYRKGSLNGLIESRFLTVREIIKYSLEFLGGLAYIHSKNLVHLDIKPSNILIDNSNKAILTDFGLSKYLDYNGVCIQNKLYTKILDPDIINSGGRTRLTDIYQAGITMYSLCNGKEVLQRQFNNYKGNDEQYLKDIKLGKYPDRSYFLPHIPKKLRNIIKKMIDIDIENRYNNIIQIMNDLSDVDQNLDWIFTNEKEDYCYFIKDNMKTSINIDNDNDLYNIRCTKTNLESQNTQNMHKFSSKGYKSIEEANKVISDIIGRI